MIGAIFSQHILNGYLLSGIGSVVTGRADIYTEGDHHVDLCLVDGLQDEM